MITTNIIKALETIATLTSDTFYADSIGLSGSTTKALHNIGYIEPTGQTQLRTIKVKQGTKELTIEVKEWAVTTLYTNLIQI